MNIFTFRDKLIADYAEYVSSFIRVREATIRDHIREKLDSGALWPQPLIQLNPSFEPGAFIDELIVEGILHPSCKEVFRRDKERSYGLPLRLHRHQEAAIRVAQKGCSCRLNCCGGSFSATTAAATDRSRYACAD